MMLHRHFAEKAAEEKKIPEPVQEQEVIPVEEEADKGADIVPEPAVKPAAKTATRTRRKK